MTPHPLTPSGVVELARIERSGLIESRHLGAAAVVGGTGSVLTALGDIDALVYPRSTLKFLQAIAVQRSGVALEGEELVLSAASHQGTPDHVSVVEGMLARAGLTADDLQCPADWPGDSASRRAAAAPSRLTMNCSGKHAAFLLACVENGWPLESYRQLDHPLQQLIVATVEEFTGAPVEHSGVDGCGAPVHAVTLRNLATAIGRVAQGLDEDAARLSSAIKNDAWALDYPSTTRVIDELGLIAKNGAEGVFVAAASDGTAVALKILDGSTRASISVGLRLLADVGAIDADRALDVANSTAERVLGAGEPVGQLIASYAATE